MGNESSANRPREAVTIDCDTFERMRAALRLSRNYYRAAAKNGGGGPEPRLAADLADGVDDLLLEADREVHHGS